MGVFIQAVSPRRFSYAVVVRLRSEPKWLAGSTIVMFGPPRMPPCANEGLLARFKKHQDGQSRDTCRGE